MEDHDTTKHSAILIAVDEDAGQTRATALLSWRSTALVGMGGVARMDADTDHAVELRDEVAVARALSNLASQIFATSMSEIESAAG